MYLGMKWSSRLVGVAFAVNATPNIDCTVVVQSWYSHHDCTMTVVMKRELSQ